MGRAGAFTCLALLALAACGAPAQDGPPPRAIPSETLTELPSTAEPAPLSEAARQKVDRLREIAGGGRLTPLVRLARAEPDFRSNFAGERHMDHWLLLRRTGVDPLMKLGALLDEPHAARQVGDEIWYVWPDLAVLPAEELIPEKLSFRNRARLRDLVGEEGIELIRGGSPYPGFRLAVSETGRWIYFLHETGD